MRACVHFLRSFISSSVCLLTCYESNNFMYICALHTQINDRQPVTLCSLDGSNYVCHLVRLRTTYILIAIQSSFCGVCGAQMYIFQLLALSGNQYVQVPNFIDAGGSLFVPKHFRTKVIVAKTELFKTIRKNVL